ncbi:MAG: radical SAM protein [Nannocystaceae bacterium]
MSLEETRRRLPVVDSLPRSRTRRILPLAPGEFHRPRLAVWEFTLACDQRCRHCGPRSTQRRPDELTTEEALALVRDLAEIGVGEVVLIGGEAYLRDDFILVIRAIREAGMACGVTTGGYNLTKARADAMVEAGVQSVSVSIDGLAESHDYVRNRPQSWARAFAALGHVRAAGARVACNSQINQRSRSELLDLAPLLADAGVTAWQIQLTVAHGNAADNPDLIVQPYMILEIEAMLHELLDRCDALGITIWPANSVGYFGPGEHRLRRALGGYYGGCHAGKSTIGIESDGAIKSCPTLGGAQNIGGSWREHGLQAIWERAPEIRYVDHRTIDDLWGYCRECYYAETCMGGCTAAAEPLLGRPGNNPFCFHRARELERQGLRERIEHCAPSSGRGFDNGLFRVITEPLDPALREAQGPVKIDEPRVSRVIEPTGPGTPVDLAAFTAEQARARSDEG